MVLIAILSVSCIGLGYFWDDYLFLTFRGTGDPRVYLLPDPGAAFYRPIPQSLYFLCLRWLDPTSGRAGHVFNLAVLAAAAGLFASLVTKLAGRKAGLMAGIAFASTGCLPGLVAWISCCQDLFSIVFVVLALWLRQTGRNLAALAAATGAVLSKESAVVILPVLVLWDWLIGRRPFRIARQTVFYGALLFFWAVIHPGFRTLLARGFQSGATGYVGMESPERWAGYFARYVLTLLNLPITGLDTPWPTGGTMYGAAALVVVLAALFWTYPQPVRRADPSALSPVRLAMIALLLLVLPLLLPSTMIRLWAPYYSTLGALGVALGLGALLARATLGWAAAGLGLYLILGIWGRGLIMTSEPVWSEAVFVEASRSARRVEANFKRIYPTLAGRTNALISVSTTGFRGIRSTLLEAQALRVWYGNPEILAIPPEKRGASAPVELLFRVTSNLDVVEIDPRQFRVQWSGSGSPHPSEISRSIRAYARGLAASGNSDEAASILQRLAAVELGQESAYDHRLVAMVLLAAGRPGAAESAMARVASFPYETRLEILRKILSEPSSSAALDSCAFPAFELSASNPDVARYLMRRFHEDGLDAQALHFARRIQEQCPGDRESAEVLRVTRVRRRT